MSAPASVQENEAVLDPAPAPHTLPEAADSVVTTRKRKAKDDGTSLAVVSDTTDTEDAKDKSARRKLTDSTFENAPSSVPSDTVIDAPPTTITTTTSIDADSVAASLALVAAKRAAATLERTSKENAAQQPSTCKVAIQLPRPPLPVMAKSSTMDIKAVSDPALDSSAPAWHPAKLAAASAASAVTAASTATAAPKGMQGGPSHMGMGNNNNNNYRGGRNNNNNNNGGNWEGRARVKPNNPAIVNRVGWTCARMRGLPFRASDDDVREFLSEGGAFPVQLIRPSDRGQAYLEFASAADVDKALSKHRNFMQSRYIEIFPMSFEDFVKSADLPRDSISVADANEKHQQQRRQTQQNHHQQQQQYQRPQQQQQDPCSPTGAQYPHQPFQPHHPHHPHQVPPHGYYPYPQHAYAPYPQQMPSPYPYYPPHPHMQAISPHNQWYSYGGGGGGSAEYVIQPYYNPHAAAGTATAVHSANATVPTTSEPSPTTSGVNSTTQQDTLPVV
jgi:hypothetical protein